jgi:hypothetical protein
MALPSSPAVLAALLAAALLAGPACARGPAAISVRGADRYQRITGWEATAYAAADHASFQDYQGELFERLVNDLGVNRLRVELRSGAETDRNHFAALDAGQIDYQSWRARRYVTVNDNADPDVINADGFFFSELDHNITRVVNPIREVMMRSGVRPLINLCYVSFVGPVSPDQYVHDDPREYGEFIEAAWRHLDRTYGWVPDSLEIMLEPDNVRQWSGTLIGQAIVEVARRLSAAGFAVPRFVAPSNTNMTKAIAYFDAAMRVDGVRGLLSEFSYHRYGGVSRSRLIAIQSRARTRGVTTSMLEWGAATHRTLHEDLKFGENSAWSMYVIGAPDPGGPGRYYHVDVSDPRRPKVDLAPKAKFLRQYFRFIRPGAVRVGAGTTRSDFDPVAFENEDGRFVVVVQADREGTFTVSGLPAGTYGITYTTAEASDQGRPDVTIRAGQPLPADIPAAGVVTVYARK